MYHAAAFQPYSLTEQVKVMDTLRVEEKAEEVRIAVEGKLHGDLVTQLMRAWQDAQSKVFWRRFVLDISKLEGFDESGHALLHEMYRCGTIFGAGTASSLMHLRRIAAVPVLFPTDASGVSKQPVLERPIVPRRPCRPSASTARARAAAQ
jgi:ABC-type transporter Mla MlaB component